MRTTAVNICLIVALVAGSPASAEEQQRRLWKSSIELGAVVTTGNTDQRNFNFRADATRDSERFRHTMHVSGLRSSEDAVVTAQKYYTHYQGDFKLNGHHALFGRVSYEDDQFSGFDYQADVTFGYTRRLLKRENMELNGDLGAGVRRTRETGAAVEDEFITRMALRYLWQISESAEFTQNLSVEVGDRSTITRSESAIQSTLVGNLAMKFAVNVKHQSEVPVGSQKTDTETAITLVYKF